MTNEELYANLCRKVQPSYSIANTWKTLYCLTSRRTPRSKPNEFVYYLHAHHALANLPQLPYAQCQAIEICILHDQRYDVAIRNSEFMFNNESDNTKRKMKLVLKHIILYAMYNEDRRTQL